MDSIWRAFRKNTISISLVIIAIIVIFFAVDNNTGPSEESVKINEVCSENLSCFYDENGEHPDWIELYNPSEEMADLSGWFLSDSEHRLDKWKFPEGTTISANGFLLLFADSTAEAEADSDESLSISDYILTGRALSAPDNGLHLNFSISGSGESLYLSDKRKALRDSVEIPKLKYDTSWARKTDGDDDFSRLSASPGESNDSSKTVLYPTLTNPQFSAESGFYDEAFRLEISSVDGAKIRYTLDGSIPDENSPEYEAAIEIRENSNEKNIYSALWQVSVELLSYVNYKYRLPDSPVDKCNIVRAAAFNDDGEISDVVTKVYFVGYDKKADYNDIGVISLVSDPEGLFDYENGIYVMGKMGVESFRHNLSMSDNAVKYLEEHPETPTDGTVSICGIKMHEYMDHNYVQKGSLWEREADIVSFDPDHRLEYSGRIGIRIKGHRTRNFAKKSLNLYARDIYGSNDLYGLGQTEKDYSRMSLFSGGNDLYTFVKDKLAEEIFEGLDFTSISYSKPYYLFMDGEFWGIYRVGDKLGAEWLSDLYGLKKDNIAVVKNSLLADGDENAAEVWSELQNFVRHADFTFESDYEKLKSMMDMDSFMEYFAARIFVDEGMDWPNTNTALWRAVEEEDQEYGDTKWRWINFDNNANFDYSSISSNTIAKARYGTSSYSPDELFSKLMENEDFRKDFQRKYAETVEKVFDPEETIERLDLLAAEVRPYVEKDYRRFFGNDISVSDFDRKIKEMRLFLKERDGYLRKYVEEECSFSNMLK